MEIFRISWSFPSEIHAKPKKEKLRQKAVPSSSCHALEKWTDFFSGKKKNKKTSRNSNSNSWRTSFPQRIRRRQMHHRDLDQRSFSKWKSQNPIRRISAAFKKFGTPIRDAKLTCLMKSWIFFRISGSLYKYIYIMNCEVSPFYNLDGI